MPDVFEFMMDETYGWEEICESEQEDEDETV